MRALLGLSSCSECLIEINKIQIKFSQLLHIQIITEIKIGI